MFDASTTVFPDAAVRPAAYAAEKAAVSARKKGVQVSGQDTNWTALMLAVRDHGDRAAFAALFNH
ncbi:MAG: hypothetical protein ACKO1H_05110, partial [Tabrizicola sp.]